MSVGRIIGFVHRNPSTDTCLDNLQNEDKTSYVLGQYACHKFMASAQVCVLLCVCLCVRMRV